MRSLLCALGPVALVLALSPSAARGHAFAPGLVELDELGGGAVAVAIKTGAGSGELAVELPAGCVALAPAAVAESGGTAIRRWLARCPALAGARVGVSGLPPGGTALVRVALANGRSTSAIVRASTPWFAVPSAPSAGIAGSYTRLGIEHILLGVDHLLFVFGLFLLVRARRRLLVTLTAFTVAHSLTLTLAALEVLALPPPPVEAAIALSILWLAVELASGRDRLASAHPAFMAFAFGLLHGLGFAGALAEVGLPPGDVPLALVGFNAGVEIGQILFVLALIGAAAAARRLLPPRIDRTGRTFAIYAMGALAAFWCLERVRAFVAPGDWLA